ncbi:prepilin peptidase [Corynebacterium macginleyi]|uniref:prepilin peptidase n=1 Tax=Corynebacterium macginleyi TaxID=38290 RepID=UPI00190DF66A|nr:A24 family peptidase [Corynebacterium macginleyi]MBK4151760.1 prepilin peptidase [Corynebacterium macginleyi]
MGIFGGIIYGLWAAALSWWDIRERRLPDVLTIPAAVLSVTFVNWGGLFWPLLYLLVALRGAGIGGGDIKLAFPLGMLVGAMAGPLAVIIACGGAAGLTLLASGVARGKDNLPHGPSMLVSAGLVMALYTLFEVEANILGCPVVPCG